jgi:hypothetical protein
MNILLVYILAVSAVIFQQRRSSEHTAMIKSISQNVCCKCGKVALTIESPSALRLVCYCKDCRGYYNTLNEQAHSHKHEEAALLDKWGGVDYTQIYPSEISVKQGQEYLKTCLIREKSPIRRVYASCCDTPLLSIGGSGAALLNSNLLPADAKPDVKFRIIGRNALPGNDRPHISWSVPLNWLWVMAGRVDKKKTEPLPLDISKPQLLDNFKQG